MNIEIILSSCIKYELIVYITKYLLERNYIRLSS